MIKSFFFNLYANSVIMKLIIFFLYVSVIYGLVDGVKDVEVHKIEVLTGETVYLPCNTSTAEGDEVVLILWYRQDIGTPIYSIDIRDGPSKAVKRWSDESVFGERAYFIFDREPGRLSIQNIQYTDMGIYRCRVDFLRAQTRNNKMKLIVVSPPERVIIRDNTNVERSTVVGPYNEGDMVLLKCEAIGGRPSPRLFWFKDGNEMEAEVDRTNDEIVASKITIGPLRRNDLNSRMACRASNHQRTIPIEAVVQIDMNFPPLNIRLLGAHQPLSAGRRYDLLCQSAGSRPPAVITWWINENRLEKTTETTSSDGNQTTSTLSIILNKTDSGKYLSCKAYNQMFPSEILEDGWRLDIQYIPEAFVRLGTSLDPSSIREGADVYFDCLVIAHPPFYRIEWKQNGQTLPHNISNGVIISNHSLVLQGVTRSSAGNYSCVAYNAEGEGTSQLFHLNILYAPRCVPNQPRIYGVAKQEDARIKCLVDANPTEVDFYWTFNNSAESIDVATNHIEVYGTSSLVTYTPITELDYGTLLCSASNKIGKQRIPCIFHIIAAGRPDQVHNCTLINISMTSLTVTCSDGFNGGLPQLFILELRDLNTNEIRANITSTVPRFTISSLTPGGIYEIAVYAYNSKGKSDPTTINAAMLRMPEKQLTSERVENRRGDLFLSPIVSLTIGLTFAVLVAGFAVIFALRIPCDNSRRRQKSFSPAQVSREGSPCPSDKSNSSKNVDGNESDERNPDVIPESVDADDHINFINRRQHVSTIATSTSPNRQMLPKTSSVKKLNEYGVIIHQPSNPGYCTLRNKMHTPVSISGFTMNLAPQLYSSSSITQCTLPRHSSHQLLQSCTGDLVNSSQMPNISSTQRNIGHTSMKSFARNHAPLRVELSAGFPTNYVTSHVSLNKTIPLQQASSNQKSVICVGAETKCISEEEVTVHTPLMIKRESTV